MDKVLSFVSGNVRLLFLGLSLLFLIVFLLVIGFSWFLILYLLVIGVVYYFVFIKSFTLSVVLTFVLLFIPFVLFITIYFVGGGSKARGVSKGEVRLSVEECKEIYDKYDGRVLDISGEGIKGSVLLEVDPDGCETEVVYTFLFNVSLERDSQREYMGYFGEHDGGESREDWDGVGSINPVYANKGVLVEPSADGGYGYFYEGYSHTGEDTDTFYNWYKSSYVMTDERYEGLLGDGEFVVLDGRDFIVDTYIDENSWSSSLDEDRAAREAPIVKRFGIVISE